MCRYTFESIPQISRISPCNLRDRIASFHFGAFSPALQAMNNAPNFSNCHCNMKQETCHFQFWSLFLLCGILSTWRIPYNKNEVADHIFSPFPYTQQNTHWKTNIGFVPYSQLLSVGRSLVCWLWQCSNSALVCTLGESWCMLHHTQISSRLHHKGSKLI